MCVSIELKNYLDERCVKYLTTPPLNPCPAQEGNYESNINVIGMVRGVILNIDGNYAMMILKTLETIDYEHMKLLLGVRYIRLASDEECRNLFPGCEPTALPVLGNIYNLQVYCSSRLLEQEQIFFNTGTHNETVKITIDDFIRELYSNVVD